MTSTTRRRSTGSRRQRYPGPPPWGFDIIPVLGPKKTALERAIRYPLDTFRRFETGAGHYTWWSQRPGARAKNIGWRIDYVMASPAAMKYVRNALLQPDVTGSIIAPSASTSTRPSSEQRSGALRRTPALP